MKNFEEEYNIKQIKHIYRSTEVFVNWLQTHEFIKKKKNLKVLDMACGTGANTMYMANKFDNCDFTGIDINKEFVDYGNNIIKERELCNCRLYKGDWLDLESKWIGAFDGVISFQSLFMFCDYREALLKLAELQPEWIALSSLFYEGDIEYTNKFRDYDRPSDGNDYTDMYYNIHSMPRFKEYMKELGYSKFDFIPFEIDIDIPRKDNLDIGTYTVKTVEGRRIQISAALMMPWYFIIACK